MRHDIVTRTTRWNEKRFKREFNYPLELSMLAEEAEELFSADTEVNKLDAIGDITFVAIGTLWKLGLPIGGIKEIFYHQDLTTLDLPHIIGWSNDCKLYGMDNLDHTIEAAWTGFTLAIDMAFMVALGSLRGIGLQPYYYDVVEAICNSNDTKVVKRTPTGQKANIDKGQTFVPPTARLLEIYLNSKMN